MAFGFLKKIFSFGKKEVIEVPQEGEAPDVAAAPLPELSAPEPAQEIEAESAVEEVAAAPLEEPASILVPAPEPEASAITGEPKHRPPRSRSLSPNRQSRNQLFWSQQSLRLNLCLEEDVVEVMPIAPGGRT